MSTKAITRKTLSIKLNTGLLEKAARVARQADVRPERVKGRLIGISFILLIGILGAGAMIISIWAGVAESESARLLTAFLLLCSIVMVLASASSLVLVIWSAYAYAYVQSLEAKAEVDEVIDQHYAMVQAASEMANDPILSSELVRLVLNAEVKKERDSRNKLAADVHAISDELRSDQGFYNVICRYFANRTGISLWRDNKDSQKASGSERVKAKA